MKRNELLPLFFGFLAIVLTGCNCTSQQTYNSFPIPIAPIDLAVVDDLRPELIWDWKICTPEQYEVQLFSKATNESRVDTGLGGLTGSSDQHWTPSVDLTLGTHYIWRVAAKAEGADPGGSTIGEFVVGPTCESPALNAPDPVYPVDRIEYQYWFVWDYTDPTCTPEGYAFQLSKNPEFTNLVINTRETNPIKGWYDYVILNNAGVLNDICTTYYWRVAAIDGPQDGPWSDISSYYIDKNGECGLLVDVESNIPELAPFCGDGEVNGDEQCDGDNMTMCLSTQVCKNCQCIFEMEETEFCEYRPLQNTNCRQSDYKESELTRSLSEEDIGTLVALNPEYTHGLFEFETGEQCWIWLVLMDGEENPFGNCPVEIIDPPEAPREGTCSADLNQRECIAAGGEWKEGMAAPYCACPEE